MEFFKAGYPEELPPEEVCRWRYEAINPVNPLKISPPKITEAHIKLLQEWASVKNTAKNSIEAVIKVSVYKSACDEVFDEVSDFVWSTLSKELVWVALRAGIDEALVDAFWAYMGYIFSPCVKKWRYVEHKEGEYPFQSAVNLWRMGLLASYNSGMWRLHGGKNMEVLWEGEI